MKQYDFESNPELALQQGLRDLEEKLGFTVHVVREIILCTNCARMHRFQQIRVTFERKADSPICCKRWLLEKTYGVVGGDCPALQAGVTGSIPVTSTNSFCHFTVAGSVSHRSLRAI